MPYLQRDGDVYVLYLGLEGQTDSDNRFHPDWMDQVHALLDQVEASQGPAALVTTATGKIFSNGLDTDWLAGNFDKTHSYLDRVHSVFARVLALPMTTVAAMNGHAFGAGAMLASAHDFRVMRSDRGFYCLPEASLNMPFPVGMNALVTTRLVNQVAVEAMTTSRRYGADDALAAGIVDEVAGAEEVLARAVARAAANAGRRGGNLGLIKAGLHRDLLAALAVPTDASNLIFAN
ncbi:enoyl-CoA hydratase/isomerase family protein [Skermania sp. ID1734]|uniref:enoyl-CoA hydratase/isomerase family protein n=1 Tax=Skermania sp. ID1734 TaxID=2597516 RepID=UPI00117E8C11|nr:enoyl-CoA hydratase/isomerase family protein [Skermania sp. ID1734]TSE02032.1 enoyl-CoA hydratase/isomerase family protein [Skermania sp. ID1734]